MTLPTENYLAAFPPVRTVRMGWLRSPVVLGPLTLGKCVLIDALGVDPCRTIAEKDAALVAFVLAEGVDEVEKVGGGGQGNLTNSTARLGPSSLSKRFKAFSRRVKRHLQELCKQVNETMADAFSTYVKPQPPKNQAAAFTPHGVGWWLSYAEALCGDYGWSWQDVLAMPLATVFALACAHRERHGVEHGGPDYVERKFIKEHLHG